MLTSENLKTMDHLMTNLIAFVEVSLYVVVFRIREDIEKGKIGSCRKLNPGL